MKPNVKHKMDSKSKINYKTMESDELIHLISNQILNENITENNKLVIQNCCKELYTKKCEKYKKVTYVKSRNNLQYCRCCSSSQEEWTCQNCDSSKDDMGLNKVKTRICEVTSNANFNTFPKEISSEMINKYERHGYYNVDDGCSCSYKAYTIIKIESI